ncbi:MAG TPA: hypothetical protein VL053_20465 [Arachidicoccus sp.]|nr:hypothetical protein [Arachidicoccus sp.]
MTKRISKILAVSLFFVVVIQRCSKSGVSPVEQPAIPPPTTIDSSLIPPTDTSVAENSVIKERSVTLSSFPVPDPTLIGRLYLGGVIKAGDLVNLSSPAIAAIDNQYRNPLTTYTDANIDSLVLKDQYPSRQHDQQLVSNIMKEGIAQYSSYNLISPRPFNARYNSLKGYFGENADIDKILDLGFADTTRLDSTKGRLFMLAKLTTTSLLLEPPIYSSYLKLKPKDKKWTSLLGNGTPQIVSGIDYGLNFIIVFESSVGNARLTLALNRYLEHSQVEILSGSALSQLSDEDQTILKNTVSYGYMSGRTTPVSHKCLAALVDYSAALSKIGQHNYFGEVISFRLNGLLEFENYTSTFTVSDYPQKSKE